MPQECGGWRWGIGVFAVGDGDVFVFCAREGTGILRGLVLERGMVGTKFPVVEGKIRHEKAIGAGGCRTP